MIAWISSTRRKDFCLDDVCIPPTTQEEVEALFVARHATRHDGLGYQYRMALGVTWVEARLEHEEDCWMLVGEWSLRGIMDGEIREEEKAGRVTFEIFALTRLGLRISRTQVKATIDRSFILCCRNLDAS